MARSSATKIKFYVKAYEKMAHFIYHIRSDIVLEVSCFHIDKCSGVDYVVRGPEVDHPAALLGGRGQGREGGGGERGLFVRFLHRHELTL